MNPRDVKLGTLVHEILAYLQNVWIFILVKEKKHSILEPVRYYVSYSTFLIASYMHPRRLNSKLQWRPRIAI